MPADDARRPPDDRPASRPATRPGEPPEGLRASAASMRAEWRAEQEAATADALEQWQHQRTLRDVLADALHRDEHVAVTVAHHRFSGAVLEVADDVLTLHTVPGRVDVHLHDGIPVMVQQTERVHLLGESGDPGEVEGRGSFRARLLTREASGGEVTLGSVLSAEPFDGVIAVGADHLSIQGRGGGATILPLHCVAYVMPRRD